MTDHSDDAPQVDDETRERSSKQRNITSPTPPDVRAKDNEDDTRNKDIEADPQETETP